MSVPQSVASTDAPQVNAGVGEGPTIENLNANIEAVLDGNAVIDNSSTPDTSQPTVQTSSTPVVTQVSEPGQTAVQPGQDVVTEDAGTIQRLKADMASKDSILKALNIDPDGDIADKLKADLITVEDLRTSVYGKAPVVPLPQVQPAEPATPTVSAEQTLANLQARIEQRGDADVAAKDYALDMKDMMTVVVDVTSQNKTLIERNNSSDLTNLQTQNASAVDAVFAASNELNALEGDLKTNAQDMLTSMADFAVVNMANDPSIGSKRAYTPQGYKFAAEQSLPKILALMKGASVTGANAAVVNIANNSTEVTPVQPASGGAPVVTPAPVMRLKDFGANFNAELANQAAIKAGQTQV